MQQDPELKELTDYSEDGVDLTLIRWSLSLTPAQRLEVLGQHMKDIEAIHKLNGIQFAEDTDTASRG